MSDKQHIRKIREWCTWLRLADDLDYETGCNNYFEDVEKMDFEACGFMYCPFCGKEINWQVSESHRL